MENYSPQIENSVAPEDEGTKWSVTGYTVEDQGLEIKPEDEQRPFQEIPQESFEGEPLSAEDPNNSSLPKKKKNVDLKKRLDQATYNNNFLAQKLAQREAEFAQQQARIQQYEEQLALKKQEDDQQFENTLDYHESDIKEKIRVAKEDGDINREVELIDQLAELKATKTTHASWKVQEELRRLDKLENEEYDTYELPLSQDYLKTPQQLELENWVNENPWYNTNPVLRREFDEIATELTNILTFNNQAHLIDSPGFMESVTNEMRKKYAYNEPAPYQSNSYYQSPTSVVAPVTRRTVPTMAQNYVNQNGTARVSTTLTKEDMERARHLPPISKNESVMDMYKRYERAKNYPRSPLPGGSPYRLTIM
jgi:hypothetical protein